MPSFSSYLVHTLDLTPGGDALFKNLRDTTRRNIKKSLREGVTTAFHTSQESVASFYRLNCTTRKEHGLPPQPYSFFEKLHEHVISRNLGFVALASIREETLRERFTSIPATELFTNTGLLYDRPRT